MTPEMQLLSDRSIGWLALGILSMVGGVVTATVYVIARTEFRMRFYWIILLSGIFLGAFFLYLQNQTQTELDKLKEIEQQSIRNHITSLSCHDLREQILDQLKTQNSTMLGFKQDWYYANCETPLKETIGNLNLNSNPLINLENKK